MPLDVELTEMSAGGILEPKAEWTAAAHTHLLAALRAHKEARGLRIVEYRAPESGHQDSDLHVQLAKLHRTVARAILTHLFYDVPNWRLPTKGDKFDWTLGPKVAALKQGYDADYALFIYIRDSYTSEERAVALVVALLLGVAIDHGAQEGFATLVDLNTGEIVWFNRLLSLTGDLRTPKAATETVKELLKGFPK
jgi:peptidoglycan/xylan/chitin deacetylase (PgdA/CDA1 family)